MKKSTLFILFALTFAFTACGWMGVRGNGHIKTEPRAITDFAELQASGMFEIEWRSGPPSLTVTTDENLMSYIQVELRDNQLRVRTRQRIAPTHGVKIVVSSSSRTGAKLTGASELVAHDLSGESFAVQTTGAASIKLDGHVDRLLADMTGASDLSAKSLLSRTAEISTTGAASADVSVSETLKVTITGAGDVTYHGNPAVSKSVTGAGEVRRKD